jgi:hypothetical protein
MTLTIFRQCPSSESWRHHHRAGSNDQGKFYRGRFGGQTRRENTMYDEKNDYDLGREIERSQLFRGEYDKVFQARGVAYLIFGGIVLAAIVLCFLLNALGIDW